MHISGLCLIWQSKFFDINLIFLNNKKNQLLPTLKHPLIHPRTGYINSKSKLWQKYCECGNLRAGGCSWSCCRRRRFSAFAFAFLPQLASLRFARCSFWPCWPRLKCILQAGNKKDINARKGHATTTTATQREGEREKNVRKIEKRTQKGNKRKKEVKKSS